MFTNCTAICTEEQRKPVRNLLKTVTRRLKTVSSMIQNSDLHKFITETLHYNTVVNSLLHFMPLLHVDIKSCLHIPVYFIVLW